MDTILENKTCHHCQDVFPIYEEDKDFYDKISPVISGKKFQIPNPTLCPDCRQQRRLAWKNELSLYKNNCHGCGIDIVSRFHRENPHKNYCHKCWGSDSWDARDYGFEVDFNTSVFSQIQKLIKATPFQNLIGSLSNIENNSTYTNCTADIKDSYMVSESDFVDNCMYGRLLRNSSYLIDCHNCSGSENCYECAHSKNLFNCLYCKESNSCSNSSYLENCISCSECIGCINLENQKYHILNTPYTKEEYFEKKQQLEDKQTLDAFLKQKDILFSRHSKVDTIVGSENCSGEHIMQSQNCFASKLILGCQDVRYSSEINDAQDIMDVSSYGSKSYKMFESMGVGRYSHGIYFCSTVGKGENLFYCVDTKKSSDCFGCVNMKFARYCIFNKQYTKQEYETLLPKLIIHMQSTGEWGEFFPLAISPFSYHETLSGELYTKTSAQLQGIGATQTTYTKADLKVDKIIPAHGVPEDITKVPKEILSLAIKCKISGKPFRIIEQELNFYKKHHISIPHIHPDERRKLRMQ